jgi:hypothetical protein
VVYRVTPTGKRGGEGARASLVGQIRLDPWFVCMTHTGYPAVIDVILSNTPENILTSGVLHIGISDHSLVYTVRKFKLSKFRPTAKEVRDFKHFSDSQFRSDLSQVHWDTI